MRLIRQMLSAQLPGAKSLNLILLVYRILIAFAMFSIHGLKKIEDIQGEINNIPDPLGLGGELTAIVAIFSNIILTAFVALGFMTRLSAVGILAVTLSGLLLVHNNDPWVIKDVPLMYSIAFALLVFTGPGQFSIDNFTSKEK